MSEPISRVTDDFITRLRDVRDSGGDRAVVDQLPSYAYRWSLEGKSILRAPVAVPFRPLRQSIMRSNIFSERELSLYAVARPSACLSVVCNARAPYLVG